MDHLAPSNVPVYGTRDEQRAIWERCAERGQPVLAVRDAERGFIVKYDLQHLGRELDDGAVQALRDRVRSRRSYPTDTDPISESEAVGGEAGPVSGELHAPTEAAARSLASYISGFVLDRSNWRSRESRRPR
ncbi:hypothetical protein [Halomicrobium urmianum]|uniref:hypothetical protein n=1 Tax=Halomicrobium urmianum TaxID=1586233 RepID=UPI001CD9D952|nr:hypothetical protein [Halomicrobium urmianum]